MSVKRRTEQAMGSLALTVKIARERLSTGEPIYVAVCLELDIASQGATVEEAKANVIEAVTLFLETASPAELVSRVPACQGSRWMASR